MKIDISKKSDDDKYIIVWTYLLGDFSDEVDIYGRLIENYHLIWSKDFSEIHLFGTKELAINNLNSGIWQEEYNLGYITIYNYKYFKENILETETL